MKTRYLLFLPALMLLITPLSLEAQRIRVTFTTAAFSGTFSGHVFLFLSKKFPDPKDHTDDPALCCFSITVKDIRPNTAVLFDDGALSYPEKLSDLERGTYYAQVVWDRNTGGRSIGSTEGNMFNEAVQLTFTHHLKAGFSIACDTAITTPPFVNTKFTQELRVPSPLLSSFHKRQVTVDGAVLLPAGYYDDTTNHYPLLIFISGFGDDYRQLSGREAKSDSIDTIPCIELFLDGNCSWGHSTYANSDNNGPWGDALVNEFIPALEKKYRCNGARFVVGHSSGGWSALWLQVNYPEAFTACWSSSPDPVDFRCFEGINLYSDRNLFYDAEGELRADATIGGFIPWLYFKDEIRMENVLFRGEQNQSWNAAWGKRMTDGRPEQLCNAQTGAIDSNVVAHWKRYDISLLLRTHWTELQPKLDGKVRISAGKSDNFSLDKSVKLLEQEMTTLGAHFIFQYYSGDHFTIWDSPQVYYRDGMRFLGDRYREWLKQHEKK